MVVILKIENMDFSYNASRKILKNIKFTLNNGEVLCILGSNGTGKTTLIRCILGFLKPSKGEIFWGNENISSLSVKKRSKLISYVPQYSALGFPYGVREVILMGRITHFKLGSSPSKEDYEIVDRVIDEMNISHIAEDIFQNLSGGEKQMVLMARALVQESEILILDEPTANLDFANQSQILQKINDLSKRGYTILMTSHFPDHALLISDKVLLIKDGEVFKYGLPEVEVSEKNLSELYETKSAVFETDIVSAGKKAKICIPIIE